MSDAELRAAIDSEMRALHEFFAIHADTVDTKTAVLFLEKTHGLSDEEIKLLLEGKGRLVVKES